MADFKIAFQRTSQIEGGWVNDPQDKGGETYRGISRKNFPGWSGWHLIDASKPATEFPANLKGYVALDTAVEVFYKTEFWDPVHGDEINSQDVANELYDTAVNFYITRAASFLQDALNLLNKNGTLFPELLSDGKIGPTTLRVVNSFKNIPALVRTMNGLQFMKYVDICRHDSTQEKFFYGWLNRTV